VDKVDDEDELHEDEEKAADHAEDHEDRLEGAVARDGEGADHQAHQDQCLDKPEAVLEH